MTYALKLLMEQYSYASKTINKLQKRKKLQQLDFPMFMLPPRIAGQLRNQKQPIEKAAMNLGKDDINKSMKF